jgi:hypothetical protein
MGKHVRNAVLATAAGLTLAGGCSAALVSATVEAGNATNPGDSPAGVQQTDDRSGRQEPTTAFPQDPPAKKNEADGAGGGLLEPKRDQSRDPRLPEGVSTATSFWDAETASGRPMAFRTLASPYWPLGTKVKIIYDGKSEVGVVEDFGPAEWAVAQHDPPAIIDLSEKMMDKLTGTRSNTVEVKFQVLEMGDGPTYRDSGTGYDTAMRGR